MMMSSINRSQQGTGSNLRSHLEVTVLSKYTNQYYSLSTQGTSHSGVQTVLQHFTNSMRIIFGSVPAVVIVTYLINASLNKM